MTPGEEILLNAITEAAKVSETADEYEGTINILSACKTLAGITHVSLALQELYRSSVVRRSHEKDFVRTVAMVQETNATMR